MEELQMVGDELVSLTPGEPEPAKTTRFVIVAAIMSALGGVLFGYDIGIVSGALLQLKEHFELSCQQQEMVVSLLLVGALIGALFGGFFVDWIGRRRAIILNTGIFITGAIILTVAPIYEVLIIGRLIVGFAVSLSAVAECIYISEISPVHKRGQLVSVNEVGITLGLLLAYLINYLLITVPSGWRYMFGLSGIPALIQGIGMFFLPPSPRFLMQKGREAAARTVLQKLRGTELIEGELSNIRNSLLTEHDYKVCDVLSSVDNMRGRFLIGVGLVFFQQCTGQTNVLYYAPTIFQSLGFESNTAATLATVGLGLVKVISTLLCLCFVDKAGRRHFLLVGAGIMTLIIFTLSIVASVSLPTGEKRACIANDFNFSTKIIPHSQDNSSRHERSAERNNLDQFIRYDLSSEIQGNQIRNSIHRDWKGLTEDGVLKSQPTVLHKVSKSHDDSAVKILSFGLPNLFYNVGLTRYESVEESPVSEGDKHSDHSRKRVKRGTGQVPSATMEQPSKVSPLRLPSGLKMAASPMLAEPGTSPKTTDKVQSATENISNAGTNQTTASSGVVVSESLDFSNDSETTGSTSQTVVTMAGNDTESLLEKGPGIPQILAFISLTLYVGAYSYGFGPVTWLLLSEIFPVGIRGRASSLATVFNWGTNVIVSMTFLDVINGIGLSWTFVIYGVICAMSFFFIYCIVPETKNRSLEQISAELKKKSHMTELSGHCCLKRMASCSSCCHDNDHQRLPLTDSNTDLSCVDEQDVPSDMTENTNI